MAQLMSLTLASVKSRLVLPFWYLLTRIVLDNGPLNGCVCVCLCVFAVCALKLLLVSHKKVYLICKKLYVKVSLEMTCLTNGEIFGEYAS